MMNATKYMRQRTEIHNVPFKFPLDLALSGLESSPVQGVFVDADGYRSVAISIDRA